MSPAHKRLSLFRLQDSCARVLLFRGGNKELKNYNSQTPFQVKRAPNFTVAGCRPEAASGPVTVATVPHAGGCAAWFCLPVHAGCFL